MTSPRLDKLDPGFPQLQLDNHDSRIEQYTQSAVTEPIFLGVGIREVRPLKGHMRIAAGVASGLGDVVDRDGALTGALHEREHMLFV